MKLQLITLPLFLKLIAPPLIIRVAFPFLNVNPLTVKVSALTIKISLACCASKIASALPYFIRFKLLLMVKLVLFSPVYVPDAILIVSPLEQSLQPLLMF